MCTRKIAVSTVAEASVAQFMSATCPYCNQVFPESRWVFGKDAATLRDNHAKGCEENPRNICFCGKVFPNAIARDKHAAICETNPANRYQCPHCRQEFATKFGVAGIFTKSGKDLRDLHVIGCNDNPANTCFCGQRFPNPNARNAHAIRCEINPANRFDCQFCRVTFVTTSSYWGFGGHDGRAARDMHQMGCQKNPKNMCFCGQIFPNPSSKERHAATCSKNPANRFECPYCHKLFVTSYGMFTVRGSTERDAHMQICSQNPVNTTCEHCQKIFVDAKGLQRLFCADATKRCESHCGACEQNPKNRFKCDRCSRCFVSSPGWFCTNDGRKCLDGHIIHCDVIPCAYSEHGADLPSGISGDWLVLAEGCVKEGQKEEDDKDDIRSGLLDKRMEGVSAESTDTGSILGDFEGEGDGIKVCDKRVSSSLTGEITGSQRAEKSDVDPIETEEDEVVCELCNADSFHDAGSIVSESGEIENDGLQNCHQSENFWNLDWDGVDSELL